MKLNIYSIYDSKADQYNLPMFMARDGQAIRAFDDLCNDEKSDVHKHAEDYTLFNLGEFDDEIGLVTPLNTPKSLGKALEFIK